jgi:hypothetical protein
MRLTRTMVASALLFALAGSPAAAQQAGGAGPMPESYREVQLRALGLQRHMLLAMADSMPESLLRDKVTPIQRDFAQQIAHAAGAVPNIAAMVLRVPRPQLPDTASSYNSRVGLKNFVNACYDWADRTLRSQSAEDRAMDGNLFGTTIKRWQLWDELHQHTMWTAGQIVANFRKNGMAPPGFGFF